MSTFAQVKDPAQLRRELSRIFDIVMAKDSTPAAIMQVRKSDNCKRGD